MVMENKNACPRFYWGYGALLWLMSFVEILFVVWCRLFGSGYYGYYYVGIVPVVFAILSFLLCSTGIVLNIVTLMTKDNFLCRYSGDLFLLSAIASILPGVINVSYHLILI